MASAKTTKVSRPLSPHLQIYRLPLSAKMSIFHRFTGIGLAAGLPVFVAWLVFVASKNSDVYDWFISLFKHPVGQVALFGWTFCFFYHFFCGIRHLFWDMNVGVNVPAVNMSGRIALATSILLTIGIWAKAYGMMP